MKAIILAAGQGTRLKSESHQLPKVLHQANGHPLLHYVLKALDFIYKKDITIVVGFLKEMIMNDKEFCDYNFAIQSERLGTGHAVKCAGDYFTDYDGDVVILCGDAPLINKQTLVDMEQFHKTNNNDCTMLSCYIDETLTGLGRIIKDGDTFKEIVEDKDCTDEQRQIKEYNTGVMIASSKKLFEELENLKTNNSKNEYYLTDIPKLFLSKGYNVGVLTTSDKNEILAVNTMEELEIVENALKANSTK